MGKVIKTVRRQRRERGLEDVPKQMSWVLRYPQR
jgi:hypothetical protein